MGGLAKRLRATRATPPGHAGDDPSRRRVFSAALEQAEELFDAAAAVGPLARPLPLFYALSQAGRAIAAAWIGNDDWRVSGHGLTQDRSSKETLEQDDVLRFRAKPHGAKGVFAAVAAAVESAGLRGAVELGALWAALPSDDISAPRDPRWFVALPVWPEAYLQTSFILHLGASHRGYVALRGQASGPDAINRLLANYKRAEGAQVEVVQKIVQERITPWGSAVPVRWPAPPIEHPPEEPPPAEVVASRVESRVPEYRHHREHWLVPRVGDPRDDLPPILLWWVLLFALSLLARYEPAAWRAALDPDGSDIAVPLEELLDDALIITPMLLTEAITRQPVLLPARV